MHSKWKVSANPIGDKMLFCVLRIRDTSKIDHSGNREYASGYMESRAEAEALADELNGK